MSRRGVQRAQIGCAAELTLRSLRRAHPIKSASTARVVQAAQLKPLAPPVAFNRVVTSQVVQAEERVTVIRDRLSRPN
jgi:hypothetical protein